MEPRQSTGPGNRKWELAAWLVVVAGIAVRCLPWKFVYTEAGVFFPGVDPYYHLWHARHLVEQFPHWSFIDPFLNFPLGAPFPYLKGFDLLIALPGFFGGGESLAAWGAFMMPLWGGAAVYLTYRFGRAVFDPACGLAAAVLTAFLCGAMNYTMLGRVDHHGAVAPVILAMFLCLLNGLRADTRRKALLWGCGCGLLAGWSVTLWVITPPIYYLPVPLLLVYLCLRGQGPKVRTAAVAAAGSAALFVTVAAGLAGNLASRPFELFLPSWIPVLLFALAALWVVTAIYRPWLSLAVPGALGVLAILSLGLGLFEIEPLTRVASVLSGSSTAFADIVESQPLLAVDGQFTLQRAVAFYSNLVLLWPCLLGVFIWLLVRTRSRDPGELLFGLFAVLGGALLLAQQRFGEYAAPGVALIIAWALVNGARHFLGYARQSGRRRAWIFAALLVAALGAAMIPVGEGLWHFATHDTTARSRILSDFGRNLARTTPDPMGADGRLAYGLLTSEEDAVVLLASARRPVVVSSFGLSEIQSHNAEGYRILLDEDEARASRRLEQLEVRYLVLSPILLRIEAMARVAGRTDEFVLLERKVVDKNVRIRARPRPPFIRCLHTRLLMADGSRTRLWGIEAPALSRFRLHLESGYATNTLGVQVPAYKAFELVPGARLTGQVQPDQPVRLSLNIRTNTGRLFTYRAETQAGQDGRFEFVVPYPTSAEKTPCRAVGPYQINAGDRVWHVRVPEETVRRGDTIAVTATSAG